jgi:murein L,D-transpeptidase YcbB/YkuD
VWTVWAALGACLSSAASAAEWQSVAPQLTLTPRGLIFSLSDPGQRSAQSDGGRAGFVQPGTDQPAAAQLETTKAAAGQDAIAHRIGETLARKLPSLFQRDQDRSAVSQFYERRNYSPIWVSATGANPRARDAIGFLRNVAADGLDPADYPIPEFGADEEKLAEAELALSAAVVRFARHASTGRVAFSRVSGSIYFEQRGPEADEILNKVSSGDSTVAALEAFHPQAAEYKALKKQLAVLRAPVPDAQPKPAAQEKGDGPKAAANAPRTKKARAKRAETNSAQTHQTKIDSVIANMERWRWMPHDLGVNYVMVNIPNYTLAVRHDGQEVWSTRIVVGKPGEQATPLISETMKSITVNPTWNVPPSIIRNEYLPALSRDPNALARKGLKMGRNSDGSIRVFQPPGERNALGRIRFNFPNRFLVYHHDTPNKNLFAKPERAFSHGCMRVQNPEQYAEVLLRLSQPEDNFTSARVRSYFGDKERNISLKRPLQVHLSYQTAFVDAAGKLQTRRDIYGLDAEITRILKAERARADVPVARSTNASSKPVMAAR